MSRPFRRYCFHLAEKLGKDVREVMSWDSTVVMEWMAYDMTNNEDWKAKYEKEQELRRQRAMSNEEKADLFKRLLGRK